MSDTITRPAPAPSAAIRALTDRVRGRVITTSDPDYDGARAVYDAMDHRRPHAVVQCTDSAGVMAVSAAARDSGVDLTFRDGGANYERLSAAKAACDPDSLVRVNQNIAPANGR